MKVEKMKVNLSLQDVEFTNKSPLTDSRLSASKHLCTSIECRTITSISSNTRGKETEQTKSNNKNSKKKTC